LTADITGFILIAGKRREREKNDENRARRRFLKARK
jgi:hypothetical protein